MSTTHHPSDGFRAWFQCATPGCGERYELTDVVYHCRRCGDHDKRSGLLEVKHDLEALKRAHSPHDWKTLFNRRYLRTKWPYGSGVWGKKEWVCPNVANENVVSIYEGGTNLFWAERLGKELGLSDLWIKLCGNSHTGSFKDLGMTVLVSMVKQMIHEGKPIRAVVCASTGDTSAALAAYCAAAGIPAVVLLPKDKVSLPQLIQPISNGALTFALDTDFDGCMSIVNELCRDETLYLANSMNSLRLEGQKTISIEIVQQFDWEEVDWVIVPVGNCGNVHAIGQGFLMMKELGIINRLPRLVGAQAQKANPLAELYRRGFPDEPFHPKKAQTTQANAIQIGDPVNVEKAIRTLQQLPGSIVEEASEDELANAAARADRNGLFTCPHTGVALAVLLKLVERRAFAPDDRIIVISTANGLKFPNFKISYHARELPEVQPRCANTPIEVTADLDVVRRELDRRL